LLSVEQDVVDSISNDHINRKYFPNVELEPTLKATFGKSILRKGKCFSSSNPNDTLGKSMARLTATAAIGLRQQP